MVVGHITVDACGSIVEQSKNIGAKHARKPDFAESARSTKVTIPVLVNRKEVFKGDALLYEKISVTKEEKPATPITQKTLLDTLLKAEPGDEPAERAGKEQRLD